MKCACCGYEQEKDFDIFKTLEPVRHNVSKVVEYPGLYYCPKCGTVKVIVTNEE